MKNYKMTITYDGTRYQGWQRLKDKDKSIQGKIEDVLSKMCSHKVEIHGSGRTDAGVHAKGQVASFKIESDKTCEEIRDYLNAYLPEDIAVSKIAEVDALFHARLTKCRKTYLYRINNSNISNVFERKYVYNVPEELDVDKMKIAASYLIGEHDFVGFSSLKKVKKSTVRTIYECRVQSAECRTQSADAVESEAKRGERHPCENCPRLASCSDDRVGAVDRVQSAEHRVTPHPPQAVPLPLKGKACATAGSELDINDNSSDEIDIYITGDGFLYNMVRIVAGTLIEIGKGERAPEDVLKVLETKNREDAGFTAPAQGLTLYEVEYQ